MKFYELKYFEDKNQKNPSIQEFRAGYDTDAVNSATHIQHYRKIDFQPDLDFVLDGKGKVTDLLRPSFVHSDYLLVSPKFYEILKVSNLLEHQCFEAVVRNGDRLLPYYFLNFYFRFDSDENDLVDLVKTKFIAEKTTFPLSIMAVPTDADGVLGELKVNSWSEYNELRSKPENDYAHKIILPFNTLYIKRKEFLKLDLFYVEFRNFGAPHFVVSEKLAKLIENSGITGVKIQPLSFEITESNGPS